MGAQVVSFHCVLKDRMGRLISSTFNKDVITFADGYGDLLRGLADGMRNMKKGEKRRITIPAEKAYGFYDPDLVVILSRKQLARSVEIRPGEEVTARINGGDLRKFRVVEIHTDSVTLDGNHPLAGQDLTFEIEATEAREATQSEIQESSVRKPERIFH